jgi:steroid 5-alpha reductase family enzyme
VNEFATPFAVNLALALVTAVLWVLIAFAVGRLRQRHATIDVFWGAGFLVIYLESLWFSNWRSHECAHPWFAQTFSAGHARWVLLIALALWSLRLSGHLAIRQRGAPEDPRYTYIMRAAEGKNETLFALRRIYLLQAALMWFISIPLQYVAFAPRFSGPWVVVGLTLMAIGIGFETVGDEQLRRFINNGANKGLTMNSGLWRYTRHPNYFGDSVVWWGIFVVAAATGWGALTVLSPLMMTRLLTSISGKPLLEGKLRKTRAGYEEYVATTSSFIPWPPKKP